MEIDTAIFVTDQINRQNAMMPVEALVQSIETSLSAAIEASAPHGMLANIAHDACRPIGWSEPRGVYLAKDMARLIGQVYRPETDAERKQIDHVRWEFIRHHQARQIEPHAEELEARITGFATERVRFWHVEATTAIESGLAAAMFPEWFIPGREHVDKDGLVDFDYLLSRTRQIHPGIFHEPTHDVLLFAHPYFRRSLSRRNTLNGYVLQSFSEAAELEGMSARLRLDPDMLGHPGSASGVMELEYWQGPKYSDDIAAIPSGVAEHKSDEGTRLFSGVDRTQIWWKNPETRTTDGVTSAFRTLEIEELIEEESPGLQDGQFGCRYAHAEYDLAERAISHFDGAIRAYHGEDYLRRIERLIDRAGKQAIYTKLFRFDGRLPIPVWKRVLSDWYRGNRLIPEYLGAPEADLVETRPPKSDELPLETPALGAFLCLERQEMPPPSVITLAPDQAILLEGNKVAVAETGPGKVGALMRSWSPPSITTIAAFDPAASLGRILLPGDPPSQADWTAVAVALAEAIVGEADSGSLERVALAVSWNFSGILTTLSIAGEASRVADLVAAAASIVIPSESASSWIAPFRDALHRFAPDLTSAVDWPRDAAIHSRLTISRADNVEFEIWPSAVASEMSKA